MGFFDDHMENADKLRKVARAALEGTKEVDDSKEAFANCMVAMFYMMDAIFSMLKVIEKKMPEKDAE